jgi:hypothetical protein
MASFGYDTNWFSSSFQHQSYSMQIPLSMGSKNMNFYCLRSKFRIKEVGQPYLSYRSFFGNLMTKTPTKATRSLFTGYSIFKSLPNWVVTQTLSALHKNWKLCPTSNTIYGWFCKSKIAILIKLNFCQPLPNFKLVIFSKDQKKSIKIRGNL